MSQYEPPKTFLFLDIETTGLSEESELLELACILVRSKDLVKVADFNILVKPLSPISDSKVWQPVATEFHAKNGLIVDIVGKQSHYPVEALTLFWNFLTDHGLPAKSCCIAGSSVHTDLAKLKKLCDKFGVMLPWDGFLHRLLDLSTLRMMDKMLGTKLFADKTDDSHRAMGDCKHDLAQLGLYRQNVEAMVKRLASKALFDEVDSFEDGPDGTHTNNEPRDIEGLR
jgi:oligoribonuclease (3'-5' exoribonuclease)